MKKTGVLALMTVLSPLCFAQNLPRVVVLPLENRAGESREKDAETITELLATFINETRRLNVIDRFALDAALAARRWRMDDWADNAKTAKMGRALNAQYIVRGTVSPLEENLLVSVRILDILTAELRSSTNIRVEDMNDAYSKMNNLSQVLIYNMGTLAQPEPAPGTESDPARLWTIGASLGSAFAAPWMTTTVRGTIAPFRHSFLELGFDFGLVHGTHDGGYYSLYPFAHYAFFWPFADAGVGGLYIGAGGGLMIVSYAFSDGKHSETIPLAELSAGLNILDMIDISYAFRTNFAGLGHKVSLGYVYRFR